MKHQSKQHIKELLSDKRFISWILNPTKETNDYWHNKIKAEPKKGKDIKNLKETMVNLKVKESPLSKERKEAIWEKIKSGTIYQRKRTIKKSLTVISIVASITVLVISYFLIPKQEMVSSINYQSYLDQNQDVNSTNIKLSLATGKVINIEEDSVSLIYSEEGGVTVNDNDMGNEVTEPAAINHLTVPFGKSSTIVFSDGTKAYVNSGTKLLYPARFDKKKREIYVEGEVFLDVSKDKDRPFVVKSSELEISVLGTSFNLKAYSDVATQTVVLVEGEVLVKGNKANKTQKLQPNQMFSYNKEDNSTVINNVDVNNYIAWIHGYILCDKTPLDEILLKLQRYYNIAIIYNAQETKDIMITGKLDLKTDIDDVLRYISFIAPVNYNNMDNGEYMISLMKK